MAITSTSINTVNKQTEKQIKQCGDPRNQRARSINLRSKGNSDAISSSDTISVTIPQIISYSITDCNSKAILESIPESNSNPSNCRTFPLQGGLRLGYCEEVAKHLSSRYVARVGLSISRHICCKILHGCNVWKCSVTVDSVLDARNQ